MNHPVIRRFVDRVRQQARSRTSVLNMPMDEAQDLANELALLLLRENELLQEISKLQNTNQVTEVVIGGGSFKS